jgi:hypothetical protein
VEPSSGCTDTVSGGETNHAKDMETSELATHPSKSLIPETSGKKLLTVLQDDDEFQFCPTLEGDLVGTSQSVSQCTAYIKAGSGPRKDVPERTPSFGKKKEREQPYECPESKTKRIGPSISPAGSVEANPKECKRPTF